MCFSKQLILVSYFLQTFCLVYLSTELTEYLQLTLTLSLFSRRGLPSGNVFLLSFWKFRIYNYIYQLTFSINLYLLSEEDTIFNKILLVFSALPSTNFEYLVTSTVGQLVIMS